MGFSYNEFHISKKIRDICGFSETIFSSSGNVIFSNIAQARIFQAQFNKNYKDSTKQLSAAELNAMGLLDEIFHLACYAYRRKKYPNAFKELLDELDKNFGREKLDSLLTDFCTEFPPVAVYKGECSIQDFLATQMVERKTKRIRSNREQVLEELMILRLDRENPAFKNFYVLFDDSSLKQNPIYDSFYSLLKAFFKKLPYWGNYGHDLMTFLKEPINFAPNDLREQLNYVRLHWADLFLAGDGDEEDFFIQKLLSATDFLSEEWKAKWQPTNGGSADYSPPNYDYLLREYEGFSTDKEWMPRVVLMAKTVLVWLFQLSKKYNRQITRLDQIPDEELDLLRERGFTGLWLIGLWERSNASRTIKQLCGNPEAAASAYSLYDYEIAGELGGWSALENLRHRLSKRGIRLASDMVPNHTGIDAKWVVERPSLFIQRNDNPFPQYTFNGPNLSSDGRVAVYLEDHYYSKTDCAVCFKRVDCSTGRETYIYHGNDGTGMPWNDTAQLDFLNPETRQAVIQEIIKVARNFPIIRFDAAMVLAKKHIKRLWYPETGKGGDIATRSEFALSAKEFDERIPEEFWREVVNTIAKEVPDTLLLAEAFWMMEGYFTRTLGMHRVYNSAFMNMLKKEENYKYRQTVKNTISFDPQILKRYVNFMNNPDEETAVAQFGKGDKYFGVCTLMSTMPGLPMFGHGQIEGFEEKYGMEYTRSYRDENPDEYLIERHKREIFPLLKNRRLFAGVEDFLFYDLRNEQGVNENVFAYSNRLQGEASLVFYNNRYERASGWIKVSCPYSIKTGSGEQDKKLVTKTLGESFCLSYEDDFYLIMQEQRSNLWYIRKSCGILNDGLFVFLDGFQSQVFLNISQKKDEDGHLKEVYEFLNGSGTPDLEITWQEIHYKVAYEEFNKFLDLYFALFENLKTGGKISSKEKTEIQTTLENFYKEANKFAQEIEGKKLSEKTKNRSSKSADKKKAKPHLAIKMIATPKFNLGTQKKFLDSKMCETLFVQKLYKLLEPLAKKDFAQKLGLERKIAEKIEKSGFAKDFTEYSAQKISEFIKKAFIFAQVRCDSLKLAELLMDSPESSYLAGTNFFDGIKWFNKECTEDSIKMAQEIFMLSSTKKSEPKIKSVFKKLDNAQKNSNYKCQEFLKLAGKKTTKSEK
ncbi:alpha-amylase [Treponema pectinovorum]|uniref:alpha-amylase family glycosyl hydrolase n=1 Tax=Treponema pectinovorum TaxID=164 RepID=UPI003D91A2D7